MFYSSHILLQTQIPESLTLRDTSFSWVIGVALFVSLALMAAARARQANVYYAVSAGMLKTQTVRLFFREVMPLRSGASMLLLLNYWVATGLLVYLIAEHFEFTVLNSWFAAIMVPVAMLFFHFFSMIFSGWISGEVDIFKAPIAMKLIGAQVSGILYFLCATFWILQPDYVEFTFQVVIWLFFAESLVRVLKSVSVVLRQGATWYYIILYFCTLEILPFLVIYYFGSQNLVE